MNYSSELDAVASAMHKARKTDMPSRWIVKERDDPMRGIIKGWGIYTEAGALVVPEVVGATVAEHDARARLIAAAPELFAALLSAVAIIEASGGDATNQRNAINKAKGE